MTIKQWRELFEKVNNDDDYIVPITTKNIDYYAEQIYNLLDEEINYKHCLKISEKVINKIKLN